MRDILHYEEKYSEKLKKEYLNEENTPYWDFVDRKFEEYLQENSESKIEEILNGNGFD